MTEVGHPVELRGQRLRLREFRPGDLKGCAHLIGDDRVTRWLSFDTTPPDAQRRWLSDVLDRARRRPRTEYCLAVCPPEQDTLIGLARLTSAGVRAAELDGALRADHWGEGLALDAANTLIRFGFRQLRLHRLAVTVRPDNVAALRLVARLGMTFEGRIRDHVLTGGTWRDSLLFSLLDDEWAGRDERR